MNPPECLFESDVASLPLLHRGKVRDLYAAGDDHLLMVATDRLSAFDVVLPAPVPGKGALLTEISRFWFQQTAHLVRNHLQLAELTLEDCLPDPQEREQVATRAVVVRRLEPLPVEAVVRGYLIGSGWKDYLEGGAVCGIRLPSGLAQAARLPEPIYTPSTKAPAGDHDQNVDFDHTVRRLGTELAEAVRAASLAVYRFAAHHAAGRGIIIADTKLEFGLDAGGRLVLMDELLTPDSSRFWPASGYRTGISPPSFDKQFVRDYLETLDWDKTAPGPRLPPEILRQTAGKYREARDRLLS